MQLARLGHGWLFEVLPGHPLPQLVNDVPKQFLIMGMRYVSTCASAVNDSDVSSEEESNDDPSRCSYRWQ